MTDATIPDTSRAAEQSLAAVTSRIEATFAQVGGYLGQSHQIFECLQADLTAISNELSGSDMGGASAALQTIADRLKGLAASLPLQIAKLKEIYAGNAAIAGILGRLIKEIQLIAIIARNARIEAATLSNNRGDFLDFTQEVLNLARQAKELVQLCEKDQEQLAHAISSALAKQSEFDSSYRRQLLSVGDDLTAAYAEIHERQMQSARTADAAAANASEISAAVAQSIVSLQAGDNVRQRLEHICDALRLVIDRDRETLVPSDSASLTEQDAGLLLGLQAEQLTDTMSSFKKELDGIGRGLVVLATDATKTIEEGRALYSDGNGGMTSFLDALKQGLAQASLLIARCEVARQSVETTTAMFEATLQKFRDTVSDLSESVTDIILVGMNASLKAAHLGREGGALVVIANELGATANQISASAEMLKPILVQVGNAADDLNALKLEEGASSIADLEAPIAQVVKSVGTSNGRLVGVVGRLSTEGGQFAGLVHDAQSLLAAFINELKVADTIAGELAVARSPIEAAAPGPTLTSLLESYLYPKYTMAEERDVHRRFCNRLGLQQPEETSCAAPSEDDVLFF